MGVRLKSKQAVLFEGKDPVDCVYILRDDDDITISGPGKRVKLLLRSPVILSVNGSESTDRLMDRRVHDWQGREECEAVHHGGTSSHVVALPNRRGSCGNAILIIVFVSVSFISEFFD